VIYRYEHEYPIRMMCRVLEVSRAGYYAWRRRPESARSRQDRGLIVEVRAIHERTRKSYGSPRIAEELKGRCGRHRVARLMREHGIVAKKARKFRPATTDSRHAHPVAENVLDRCFQVAAPNLVWASDITFVWTREGWLYLAVVLDLFSRMVVGWATSARVDGDLVLDALRMAKARRSPKEGLIHHSDRGRQYASNDFRGELVQLGAVASMSRKGNCYDNAVVESFMASFKVEWVSGQSYDSRRKAADDIASYIEGFYNPERRHSTLGQVSPSEYERAWIDEQRRNVSRNGLAGGARIDDLGSSKGCGTFVPSTESLN
jgi:transposase InsO family protein